MSRRRTRSSGSSRRDAVLVREDRLRPAVTVLVDRHGHARITGEIGVSANPISGMTIATLILTCTIFVALGWTGDVYAPIAIAVGALVCIAASGAVLAARA